MLGLDILLIGAANFVFIFLKAFQQRNVAFLHYWWVPPVSLMLAVAEVFVVGTVAIKATTVVTFISLWPLVVAIGIGGGLGALASMYIHHKYIGEEHAVVRHQMRRVLPRVGSIQSLRRSN